MQIFVHSEIDTDNENRNKINDDIYLYFYLSILLIHSSLKETLFNKYKNALESDQFDYQFSKQSISLKNELLDIEMPKDKNDIPVFNSMII